MVIFCPRACVYLTHLQEIILLVLLYSPAADKEIVPDEGDGPGASVDPVKNAVLEWLMKEIRNVTVTRSAVQEPSKLTKVLWNQDPTLLGQVSSQQLTFFREHIKYLVQRWRVFKLKTVHQ